MFIAALSFAGMHTLVKSIEDLHVFEILFFRSMVTAVLCMLYLKQNQIPLIGKNQKWLFIRALSGIISMTLFFVTLQRMPFGASVSLKYLAPIFTAVFAFAFLKEKIRPIQWLFFFLALTGVFLLKGFDTRIDTLNLVLGIIGALFGGLVYVLIRKIGESEHPMVIINYFMSSAAILAGIAMIPFWKTPSIIEGLLLVSIGILGYFGQVYMTKSLQIELASRVAPIKYMEVIYSLIIGFIWFGEQYAFLSFIGITLIIGSMLLNLLVKNKKPSNE